MNKTNLDDKISYRILKVLHITAYIPYPIISLLVIMDYGRIYNSITHSYLWSIKETILSFIITTVIYIIIVELIYRAFYYILFGKKK